MAVFTVTNLKDNGAGSLRQAINDANTRGGADIIEFADALSGGTIVLTSGELNINDAVTINGLGAEELTIDAANNSRVFVIDDRNRNNKIDVTIDGLKITGGLGKEDYEIDYYTGEITIIDNGSGGGIKNQEKLTITNSIISGNTTDSFLTYAASGIDNEGDLTLVASLVSGNTGGRGIVNEGEATIIDTTISKNGYISYEGGTRIAEAGGILNSNRLTIINSTISNNLAFRGAGIYNNPSANTTIINSTVSGNTSINRGGGIENIGGTIKLKNSTITQNQILVAPGFDSGGGIYSINNNNNNNLVEVSNSIIAGNRNGDVVVGESNYNLISSLGSNIIGTGNGIANFNQTGDVIGITDPGLEDLADNGGLTATHALSPDSPAINAGNNALIPQDTVDLDGDGDTTELLPVDQRGQPRIEAGTVDVGAFESTFNNISLPTVTLVATEPLAIEGQQQGVYRLSRTGNTSNSLNVLLTATGSNGLAVDDFDLSSVSGTFPNFTVTIPAGKSFVELKLTAINESILEPDETLTLDINADPAYQIDTINNSDTVTLWDSEGIFIVTNTNDSGLGSLRQAILNANVRPGANTITFDASLSGKTIALTSGELQIDDDLNIEGLGADHLTISGNDSSRIFLISDGDSNRNIEVVIQGLTLTQGRSSWGGSIFNDESLLITNSRIQNNISTDRGGGIYNSNGGELRLTNSIISGNTAELYSGGGIENEQGSVFLDNSIISGNTALTFGEGAGIKNFRGTVQIVNSTITNNTAASTGGGIASSGYSNNNLTIINSIITNNRAGEGAGGGGIDSGGGAMILNSTISNNAASSGGGIVNTGNLIVTNTTISGNSAINDEFERYANGGGILNFGNLSLTNNTIVNNTASNGGGVFNWPYGSQVEVASTIIAGNKNNVNNGNPDISGNFTSNGFNLIGNSTGGTGFTNGVNNDLVGEATNPIDPNLSPLQDNGGATLTHIPLPGSPAIDAGSNPNNLVTDQRGAPREVGATPDIGAVEVTDTTLVGNDTSNSFPGTTGSDFLDGQSGNDALSGGIGNDGIRGGTGSDRLTGGDGNDVIIGGADRDILLGGNGADIFLFELLTDSLATAPDRIRDFNSLNGDRFLLLPTNPTALFNAGVVVADNLNNAVETAYQNKNQVTAGQTLGATEAIFFSFGGRSYLSINDNVAGFNPYVDLVAEVSGITLAPGDETAGVLNVANYFV